MKHRRLFILELLIATLISSYIYAANTPIMIWSGDPYSKKVALTFDDGPKPEFSIPLLDLLDKYGVRATFFVVGKEAKTYPDIIYRMATAGHDVGNHTFSHIRLDTMSEKEIALELSSTNEILKEITGQDIHIFRPPGGRYNQLVLHQLAPLHLQAIMWNVNAGDYTAPTTQFSIPDEYRKDKNIVFNKNADKIYNDIIKKISGGSIVLFHNGNPQTLQVLPKLITTLRQKGYSLVTVSELLK